MRYGPWSRRLATPILAALLLGLATACSPAPNDSTSSPSAPADLPPVSTVPQILDTNRLQLPLDTYLLSLDEANQRDATRRSLLRRCMHRFGVRVTIPEPPAGVGLKSLNERRYGLTDAAGAAKLGYGLGERDPRARRGGRDDAPALRPRALAVMTGRGPSLPPHLPKDGCSGEVKRSMTPVDPSTRKALDEYLPQRLSFETFQHSQADPRVQSAFSDWSACMRARGHDYKTPLDPPADRAFRVSGSVAERRTAQDDVACKVDTNLVGRWYSVESAYQTALIADNKAALTELSKAEVVVTRYVKQVSTPSTNSDG